MFHDTENSMFHAKNASPCKPNAKEIGAKKSSGKTGSNGTKNN